MGNKSSPRDVELEHMSKEAYLDDCHFAIVRTAADMLDGRVGFFIGSRKMRSLLIESGLDLSDPELKIFTAIDSETDALPLGDVRQHWDAEALRRLEPEIHPSAAALDQSAA